MERIKKIESKTIQKNLTDNFIKLMPTFYEMESSFLSGVYKRYGTDFSKLTERTGWMPQIPFDAGLAGTVRFYLNK